MTPRFTQHDTNHLPNMSHAHVRQVIIQITNAQGWPQHASNGWTPSTVGGPFDDTAPAWVMIACTPPHMARGWTDLAELDRFARWLARFGWALERHSLGGDHVVRGFYRLVPCVVIPEPADPACALSAAQRAMAALTDEQRLEVMVDYCRGCGCVQPETGMWCQCDNDE